MLKQKENYRQDLLPLADLCLTYDIYVEKHGDHKLTFHCAEHRLLQGHRFRAPRLAK
jgi:hypothetical protein